MNIPCNIDPLGNRDILPAGYTRIAYLMPAGPTSHLAVDLGATADTGCRARGFFDHSRASDFASKWFILIGDIHSWGPLMYFSTAHALGYRTRASALYPQKDGLPSVTTSSQVTNGYDINGDFLVNYNWRGNMQWKYKDAASSIARELDPVGKPQDANTIVIFGRPEVVENWSGGVREVSFSRGDTIISHVVPVLNDLGQPTMWDMVRKIPLRKYRDGDFIAGIDTQTQFNDMLQKLPDRTGQEVGILQVRLPEMLQTAANEAALDAMINKNWEITQAI